MGLHDNGSDINEIVVLFAVVGFIITHQLLQASWGLQVVSLAQAWTALSCFPTHSWWIGPAFTCLPPRGNQSKDISAFLLSWRRPGSADRDRSWSTQLDRWTVRQFSNYGHRYTLSSVKISLRLSWIFQSKAKAKSSILAFSPTSPSGKKKKTAFLLSEKISPLALSSKG